MDSSNNFSFAYNLDSNICFKKWQSQGSSNVKENEQVGYNSQVSSVTIKPREDPDSPPLLELETTCGSEMEIEYGDKEYMMDAKTVERNRKGSGNIFEFMAYKIIVRSRIMSEQIIKQDNKL